MKEGKAVVNCNECMTSYSLNHHSSCPECRRSHRLFGLPEEDSGTPMPEPILSVAMPEPPMDEVNNPKHYWIFPDLQAIDVIRKTLSKEEYKGYLKGNILKCRLRAGKKSDPITCIEKADWYSTELDRLVE